MAETPIDEPVTRKRRRPAVVCTECRRRKIACDRTQPCTQCTLANTTCVYHPPYSGTAKAPRVSGPTPAAIPRTPQTVSLSQHHSVPIAAGSPCNIVAVSQPSPPEPWPAHLRETLGTEFPSKSTAQPTVWDHLGMLSVPLKTPLRCIFQKTRLYGPSHWMNQVSGYEVLIRLYRDFATDEKDGVAEMVSKCKDVARRIKKRTALTSTDDLRSCLPSRAVCDEMIKLYFRTFETIFRIVHVPSFYDCYEKFWTDRHVVSDMFVAKMLLMISIGTCFADDDGHEGFESTLHHEAAQWIYATQAWIHSALDKHRLTLQFVQCQCLLILALQTNAIGGDLTYIATGSLLTCAMNMGLHRDPSNIPGMSPFETETRRQLWASTKEISLQASFAAGMPPMISQDEYDTEPPANIDDGQMNPDSTQSPTPRPDSEHTQCSVLRLLMKTYHARLKIAKTLNGLRSDSSFDTVVQLGNELWSLCRQARHDLDGFRKNSDAGVGTKPSTFTTSVLDIMLRRFMLSLHVPFGREAEHNVAFYFFRKSAVEHALVILSYDADIGKESAARANDYLSLRRYGRGILRAIWIQASSTVHHELTFQLAEEGRGPITLSLAQRELYQTVKTLLITSWKRVLAGETHVRGHIFFTCVMAQIDALREGKSVHDEVTVAAKRALLDCDKVLQRQLELQIARTSAATMASEVTTEASSAPPTIFDEWAFDMQGTNDWLSSAWEGDFIG